MYNNSDFLYPVVGGWAAGATVSLSDPTLAPDTMAEQMELLKPKFVFCSPDALERVMKAAESLEDEKPRVVVVNGKKAAGLEDGWIRLEEMIQGADEVMPEVHKQVLKGRNG